MQGLRCAVLALVAQRRVDHVARDLGGIAEQQAECVFHRLAAVGGGKAAQIIQVDLGANATWCDQGQRCQPRWSGLGYEQSYRAAERMTGKMHLGRAERIERGKHGAGQHRHAAADIGDRRSTMRRQVDGVHRAPFGERRLIEQPAVERAAKAMRQHDRQSRTLTHRQHIEVDSTGPEQAGGRRARLGLFDGPAAVLGDESVYLDFGHTGIRDDAEQCADCGGFASRNDLAAQHATRQRLQDIGDLGGFNIDNLRARRNVATFADAPAGDLTLGHGHAPFRHGDHFDARGHVYLPCPKTRRTAASTLATDGMNAASSEGA